MFIFMAPPLWAWGGGGAGGGAGGGGRATLLPLAMMGLSFAVNSGMPWLMLPTLGLLAFPDLGERVRDWAAQRTWLPFAVMGLSVLISFLQAWFYDPADGAGWADDDDAWDRRQRRGREYGEAHRATAAGRAAASDSGAGAAATTTRVGGHDGSWSGSVIGDFFFTMLLMAAFFMLPQIFAYVNRWMLQSLPEPHRNVWQRWAAFMQGPPRAPGSMPTSASALRKLEEIVLEERHLLQEGSPGGIPCAVCLDDMKIGERVKRLPCKHLFHGPCVLPWLEKHNSCPTCRFELETSDPEYERHRRARQEQSAQQDAARRARNVESEVRERRAQEADDRARHEQEVAAAFAQFDRARRLQSERERLSRLSVLELKSLARIRNIELRGCVEKVELVERIACAMV